MTINYPFQFDDYPTIFEDPNVDNLNDLLRIRLSERPIRKISIIFDRVIFGDNVVYYRIENILLYFLTIILTSLFTLKITKDKAFALMTIFLFGLHPTHMENILIITHRKELFLYIFSILAFLFHADKKKILSLLFFFLALLSKEVAIILPLLFYLYDRIFQREINKKLYCIYGGIFVAGILTVTLFSKFTGFYIPSPFNIEEYFKINRMLRGSNYLDIVKIQPILFAKYLKNLFLPFNLNVDYYIPVNERVGLLWITGFLVLAGYFVFLYFSRRNKILFFGLLFFAISYLPLSNFVPVLNLFADRYLFFPSFALILIFYSLYELLKKNSILFYAISFIFLIISLSYMPVFKSEISLWSYVVSKNPKSVVGQNNLGLYYLKAGDIKSAEEHLIKAIENDSLYVNAYINLGALYAQRRDFHNSLKYLERAKDVEPDNVKALYNLGLTYMHLGMSGKAQEIMREIIRISPEYSLAYNNLGASCFEQGMMNENAIKFLYGGMCYALVPFFIENTFENYLTAKEYFEKGLYIDPSYMKLKQNVERINQKLRGE